MSASARTQASTPPACPVERAVAQEPLTAVVESWTDKPSGAFETTFSGAQRSTAWFEATETRMIQKLFLVLCGLSLTLVQAYAQTTSHDPGTEFGQSNQLMGWPFWIIVLVIIAAGLLFTFGSRRGRK